MEELIKKALSRSNKVSQNSLIEKIIPVGGGCIHKAWCIHFQNGRRVFAKSNHIDNINMFKFERECLSVLKRFADKSYLCVPKTLDLVSYQNISIHFLEWIDLKQCQQNLLGKGLALLHKSSSESSQKDFGWEEEGFIGSNRQIRGWSSNWGEFFVNYRLRPQLIQAKSWGVDVNDYKDILIFLSSYLNDHHPKISIVHGDLWSGNCGSTNNSLGSLYDPASYWADREVDISMTKLFGGFNREFYKGYEEIWPLDKFSKDRTDIYNLYHLLNHANIFGGSYKENSLRILKDLRSRF
ncbi:fructosamine kinase family protein [Prochlorococcus sp. MIT 0801]|uniref:fructosamine kinase family protein n=1 Tax=Prochlorococcus sp. MIT 0801 TaxID=1501269 RepID=UPI0004F5E9C6|nr:fructosamine kinase family protein [Prochlorococcus sp. MIT 0801]AIQ98177.1 Ribulosamine/erythrulosamine 3-kinase potentially involved in protein deglycation [Prochlorococcus sp. MIT 0801]